MSERNKKKVWKRQEREEGNDRRWSLAPSCESFRRGSKHGSVCLLWELREMCLCESALSSGSVCLWMFVCLCLVMYRLLVHEYTVCVCVSVEVNSSSPLCEGVVLEPSAQLLIGVCLQADSQS